MEPSVLEKRMYRAMKRAFMYRWVTLGRRCEGGTLTIPKHLTTHKCHRCEAHTESAYKEDEYGKRRADLSNRLRMRFIDSSGSSEMRS
jgi:hypothetical protein